MTGDLDQLFMCPDCGGSLLSGGAYVCERCGTKYQRDSEIAVLMPQLSTAAQSQAAWFDEAVDADFEIERPRGGPRLYAWMMQEKFRRSVANLDIRGKHVLTVCGGSGMEAEFLAREGADVTTSDSSIGAVKRAAARGVRHGCDLRLLVADVERLPLRDESVDVVYVHDGLHHIEEPLVGLREMARVARQVVCITEPADAAITSLAVKLGIATEREEAGNRVGRLSVARVRETLTEAGFRIVRVERYGMFYRHQPGFAMRLFSRPVLFSIAKHSLRFANAIAGRWGNKLTVVAVRK